MYPVIRLSSLVMMEMAHLGWSPVRSRRHEWIMQTRDSDCCTACNESSQWTPVTSWGKRSLWSPDGEGVSLGLVHRWVNVACHLELKTDCGGPEGTAVKGSALGGHSCKEKWPEESIYKGTVVMAWLVDQGVGRKKTGKSGMKMSEETHMKGLRRIGTQQAALGVSQ